MSAWRKLGWDHFLELDLWPRVIQPPELGTVVEIPKVGGLLHPYERRAP